LATTMKPAITSFITGILACLFFFSSSAQDSTGCIDISRIALMQNITNQASSKYISSPGELLTLHSVSDFKPGPVKKGVIPVKDVTKTLLLTFSACNSGDTAITIYFFPGYYFSDIELFRYDSQQFRALPRLLPRNSDSIGYRGFSLQGHEQSQILVRLRYVKTYINIVRPRLVNREYLPSFMAALHSNNMNNDLMTYIFCGLLLMMVLYSLSNFIQGANPEFLYYSGYAFFLGSMLLTKAIYNYNCSYLTYFLESYLDFILQSLGIMFYMIFMQRFLDTRNKYPFLYKFYNVGIIMLAISMLSYSFFHFFTSNFVAENGIENITKVFLLVMVLIFLVYSVAQWKDKLMRYLFWGNLCLFIFSLLSQLIIMMPVLRGLPGLFGSSLFYYEIGLLLELVFFLAGLNQKNRRQIIEQTRERESLKAQNQMKEYEKELAVYKAQQEERERISADMHDELGSGMTAIRLMSEIARNKMKENTPVELEKISSSADDVLNKMNAIIWSMNSGNDTLDNLVSYIRSYAHEYFENTTVECVVHSPVDIPEKELAGDKRRNVFLCVKESLHNALIHA
jgi:signal transduction histidine kinase